MAVTGLGLALIAVLTLRPNPQGILEAAATPFTCMPCGEFGGVDMILNVILFVPLGIGLGLRGVSRYRALLVIAVTTITVESLQAWWIPGRDASVSDLVTNTVGGALGIWLAAGWRGLIFPVARASRFLAIGVLGAWLLLWCASAVLLQPEPPAPSWYAQLAPVGVTRADYPGKFISADLNGRELPDGLIENPDGLLQGGATDTATVVVRAAPAGPTPEAASIFSIFSGRQEEALMVAQIGRDLLLRSRRRANDFLLHSPGVKLADAAGIAGDTLQFRGVMGRGLLSIRAERGGRTDSTTMHITPSLGWSLISPVNIGFPGLTTPLGWIWIAGLLFPVGYWGRRADLLAAGGQIFWWTAVATAVVFGLWAIPALAAIALPGAGDVVAAAAGLALGAGAARASIRKDQG
jgi:hypothetical protein